MTGPDDPYVPPPAFAPVEARQEPMGPGYAGLAPLIDEDPRGRRRRVLGIVALVLALIAGAAVAAELVFSGSDEPTRVKLPESFAGYARERSTVAARLERTYRAYVGSNAQTRRVLKWASISSYTHGSGAVVDLLTVVFPSAPIPFDTSHTHDELTARLLDLAPNAGYFPVGPHGGSSRCVRHDVSRLRITICAWSDSRTSGVLAAYGPPVGSSVLSPAQLSAVTLKLRDVID